MKRVLLIRLAALIPSVTGLIIDLIALDMAIAGDFTTAFLIFLLSLVLCFLAALIIANNLKVFFGENNE